jgi:long-chain-fatty-acid--CoA ligase ACSBG
MSHLKVSDRASVAIMGFNSPEWALSFMGGLLGNCIITGLYSTSEPAACLYQINHSETEVITVDTVERLRRILVHIDEMPQVKAVVLWDGEIPEDCKDERVYLWKDFMEMGKNSGVEDASIQVKYKD